MNPILRLTLGVASLFPAVALAADPTPSLLSAGPLSNPETAQSYTLADGPVVAAGDVVLFDQASTYLNYNIPNVASPTLGTDIWAADDFSTDAGWSIHDLTLVASSLTGVPFTTPVDVNVFAAGSDVPQGAPVCAYSNLPVSATVVPPSADMNRLAVHLPTACALTQGHYWLALRFKEAPGPTVGAIAVATGGPRGAPDALLVLSAGSLGLSCPASWVPTTDCAGEPFGTPNLAFALSGTKSATGVNIAPTASLRVTPGFANASQAPGVHTMQTLTLANAGRGVLTWQANGSTGKPAVADEQAHFATAEQTEAVAAATAKVRRSAGKRLGLARMEDVLMGRDATPAAEAPSLALAPHAVVPGYTDKVLGGALGTTEYDSLDLLHPSASLTPFLASGPLGSYAGAFLPDDNGQLTVIDNSFQNGLWRLNTSTGASTWVGTVSAPLPVPYGFIDLKYDASTGTAFVIGMQNQQTYLLRLNGDRTGTTLVGAFRQNGTPVEIVKVAVAPSGLMYGIGTPTNDNIPTLYAIDKTTGAVSALALLSLGDDTEYLFLNQGLDFDPATGVLYWLANMTHRSNLFDLSTRAATLNLANGQGTIIEDFHAQIQFDYLAIARPTVVCQAAASVPWLTLTPSSGSIAGGATQPLTLDFSSVGRLPGTYTARVCVASNDPLRPVVAVPVSMKVGRSTAQ